MAWINRELAIGYVLGALAVMLAVILLFNQYSIYITANFTCTRPINITSIRGNALVLLNNTLDEPSQVALTVMYHIPQTTLVLPLVNTTIIQPHSYKVLAFGNVESILVNCSSPVNVTVAELTRPQYYYFAWAAMFISFVLSLGFAIVGLVRIIEGNA